MNSIASNQLLTRYPFASRISRRRLLTIGRLAVGALAIVSAMGCRPSAEPAAEDRSTESSARRGGAAPPVHDVAVQLNWFPEAEHGGVYQAAADGTYEQAGFRVEIRSGGGATPVAAEVVLGRAQFAITNADDVVLFRQQGADIVAVLAAMQNHPRCILVRSDSGVETFDDLAGKTLQRQAGRPYLAFLRARGYLDQVREVPYHGSVAALVSDADIAIQGYSFAEPLLARQQGVEVKTLMLSDLGWNPYSSVLVTSGELIREQPELVQRFVEATRQGWQSYLVDPALGNASILKANSQGMTEEALRFGSEELRPLAMPEGLPIEDVGMMTEDRWETLVQQMAELDLIDPTQVTAQACFTTQFQHSGQEPTN